MKIIRVSNKLDWDVDEEREDDFFWNEHKDEEKNNRPQDTYDKVDSFSELKEQAKKVNDKFNDLANEQRGEPESAMNKLTRGNNLIFWGTLLEHMGDLIHRMSQDPSFYLGGHEYVLDKVKNAFYNLRFKHEIDKIDLNDNVLQLAEDYVNAHKRLPVYNRVQYLARQCAIQTGQRDFDGLAESLTELKKYLDMGKIKWAREALKDENN